MAYASNFDFGRSGAGHSPRCPIRISAPIRVCSDQDSQALHNSNPITHCISLISSPALSVVSAPDIYAKRTAIRVRTRRVSSVATVPTNDEGPRS